MDIKRYKAPSNPDWVPVVREHEWYGINAGWVLGLQFKLWYFWRGTERGVPRTLRMVHLGTVRGDPFVGLRGQYPRVLRRPEKRAHAHRHQLLHSESQRGGYTGFAGVPGTNRRRGRDRDLVVRRTGMQAHTVFSGKFIIMFDRTITPVTALSPCGLARHSHLTLTLSLCLKVPELECC